jgi:hypothetical protein
MSPVFFDSNILIDHLNDVSAATSLLGEHSNRAVSAVVWMEVLVGEMSASSEAKTRRILSWFQKFEIDSPIQERAILARKQHRLKLLDAIIYATAAHYNAVLYTRDAKDFPQGDPRIIVPYTL